ncbi:MAG TPA: hypothetical protein VG826_17565 [Pirellulales bacterium]|nr:hypothetical protein [Pirellulales bacterium]
MATNLSSFRPSPASGKEVAVTLFRRTFGGQEESSQKGSSEEEGSQEEDREEEVAWSFGAAELAVPKLPAKKRRERNARLD